jgi:hypothetical protein
MLLVIQKNGVLLRSYLSSTHISFTNLKYLLRQEDAACLTLDHFVCWDEATRGPRVDKLDLHTKQATHLFHALVTAMKEANSH